MNKIFKFQLVILSVAFNLAFIAMWAAYGRPQTTGSQETSMSCQGDVQVHCPLHRELNVDEKQWADIETDLNDFQQGCQMLCSNMDKLRLDIIDLLAAPKVDLAALQTKQEAILTGQRQMQSLVVKQLLAEKDVLTPEQQERLFELLRQNINIQN